MATITVNPDGTLSLNLNTEERITYDGLERDRLANVITLWLRDEFRSSWQPRIEKLTRPQKEILVEFLADVIAENAAQGLAGGGRP